MSRIKSCNDYFYLEQLSLIYLYKSFILNFKLHKIPTVSSVK